MPILNYNHKPTPQFHDDREHAILRKQPKPRCFYGIEIEVEQNIRVASVDRDTAAEDLEAAMGGLVYCKHDGSLRQGFEIVSHPFSWEWFVKHKDAFKPVFALGRKGYRSYDTSTCGFHVHMSRDSIGALGTFKLLEFAYRWPSFWFRLSNRSTERKMNAWASCRPADGAAYSRNRIKRTTKAKIGSPQRYSAVNVTAKTVEIRIFRGIIAKIGFMRTMECCRALYLFSQLAPLTDLTPTRFFRIVAEYRKELPYFSDVFKAEVAPYIKAKTVAKAAQAA